MARATLFSVGLLALASAQKCATPAPPPAASFDLSKCACGWPLLSNPRAAPSSPLTPSPRAVFGAWFEIARIQTEGGNLIQQFCACTQLIYTPTPNATNASDGSVNNSCRFESPTGAWLNATSYLSGGGAKGGHWIEQYFPGGPQASYNVIIAGTDARGVDYFVEYDCSVGILGQSNYCIHILSRQPTGFDQALLAALVQEAAVTMALNPEHRVLNITMQAGCW